MVELLVAHFPGRNFQLIGDAAYTNSSLIKGRPDNVTLIGRGRIDAALFAPPPRPRRGQKGRPRVRGKRLPSPQQQARSKRAKWKKVEVEVYGKTATVRVLVIDALWYVAAGSELMRLVLVRGFPGHDHDDVFVCTDTAMSPRQIIEAYSRSWSLEVTFHESKGKLGFEDPQNRTEHAVERTAPMALTPRRVRRVRPRAWALTVAFFRRPRRAWHPRWPRFLRRKLPITGGRNDIRQGAWRRVQLADVSVSSWR